jgi:hypothetical protein
VQAKGVDWMLKMTSTGARAGRWGRLDVKNDIRWQPNMTEIYKIQNSIF